MQRLLGPWPSTYLASCHKQSFGPQCSTKNSARRCSYAANCLDAEFQNAFHVLRHQSGLVNQAAKPEPAVNEEVRHTLPISTTDCHGRTTNTMAAVARSPRPSSLLAAETRCSSLTLGPSLGRARTRTSACRASR